MKSGKFITFEGPEGAGKSIHQGERTGWSPADKLGAEDIQFQGRADDMLCIP